jgi:hypothetical protein
MVLSLRSQRYSDQIAHEIVWSGRTRGRVGNRTGNWVIELEVDADRRLSGRTMCEEAVSNTNVRP